VDLAEAPRLLVFSLVVYGFAPGAALRVIVRVYPKGHPRRNELIGELYSRPRWERPFFVAEQLETALFEALPQRLHLLRRGRAVRRLLPAWIRLTASTRWLLTRRRHKSWIMTLWWRPKALTVIEDLHTDEDFPILDAVCDALVAIEALGPPGQDEALMCPIDGTDWMIVCGRHRPEGIVVNYLGPAANVPGG
jgi:hypothetical protein